MLLDYDTIITANQWLLPRTITHKREHCTKGGRFMTKIILFFLSCLFLVACSGNGAGVPAKPSTPAQAIAILEKSGVLLKLDRTKSVAGTVTNKNGIRDDINAWIDSKPVSVPQKKALVQHAQALQISITADPTDPSVVKNTGVIIVRSVNCIFSRFSTAQAIKIAADLKKNTFNTKERFLAISKMSEAANGSVLHMPDGDTCDE